MGLRLFNQLPKATRKILYLRNVEGMTLDDIALLLPDRKQVLSRLFRLPANK